MAPPSRSTTGRAVEVTTWRRVKRTTFVIGTDGLILDVINSETHMHVHADRLSAR